MKLAVVTNYFPCKEQPYRGHSAYQTIRRLVQKADVEVFAPQLRYPSFFSPRHRPWAETDTSFIVPDVKTTFFHYPAFPILSRPFNGNICAHFLEPLLRHSKFDLLLNYWIYPDGFAAVKVGKKLGIPVILKAIGSDINSTSGLSKKFTRQAMQEADMVLTVSSALRNNVITMGIDAERVQSVLNGCDTSIFFPRSKIEARRELRLDARKKHVLYVGRLDIEKGLLELVSAIGIVRRSIPEVQLTLVGEGPARGNLQRLIEKEHLQATVQFCGPFKSSELGRWFGACDVFALPSHNEGCPNALIEALNSGRPVVASDVGGIPELLSAESGILVKPRDIVSLARALVDALQQSWNDSSIALSNRRSWDYVADEVIEICARVIQNRATQANYPQTSKT